MFYLMSKFFGFFLIPLHFLVALGVVGVAMLASRQDRAAKVLMASSILLLAAIGFLPVGVALTLPLEQRFPPWTEGPSAPNGIIVLGGALDPDISKARHSFALSGGAERVTAGILLAHRFPNALLVFSGGDVDPRKPREADISARFAEQMGVPRARLIIEDRSRSTAENAAFTKDRLEPKAGQRWVLVTSAMHMPRAVGAFRHVGFPVEAYPVDYTTTGPADAGHLSNSIEGGVIRTDAAVHEWIGLIAYRLLGRTNALFPGP
ncbi:MAG TPA: YdcF family protein [Pseudolabrys sp.]|uniref:YdcF family protein n=1 Tax=Pseudolabrys sp. TaxID=1960880 RepID=UPI002DDD1AB3|nr:YdcF family protein [Pseudolabrys sp.]HEV2630202.1 YdcF family protein [Pseudolabrys sp.]